MPGEPQLSADLRAFLCLLFCNDIAAGRQQAKGQRSAQDVSHSLSHQHTLILEQMYADHQCNRNTTP